MRYFPIPSMSVMGNRTDLATTTSPAPVRDWSFDTASQSNRISGGPRVEILAGRKWKFSVEVLFDRLKYTKFTSVAWGTDDPATTNDERSHMFRSEDTRASCGMCRCWLNITDLARAAGRSSISPEELR